MHKISVASLKDRKEADIVIVAAFAAKKEPAMATLEKEFAPLSSFPMKAGDFTAKEKQTMLLYRNEGQEKRVLFIGLGEEEKCSLETLRTCFAIAFKASHLKSVRHVNVIIPKVKGLKPREVEKAVVEGVLLAGYKFDQFKSKKEEKGEIESISFCGEMDLSLLKKTETLIAAVNMTRDLVNGNADDVNVDAFKALAKELGKKQKVKVSILDKKKLEQEKMGLILAVGQGATVDPAVIVLEYRGDPSSKETIGIVGKGVTFDTGGLNIKVAGSGMETMKCDMAGAAVVMGVIQACADLKLKINVVGAVGIAENAIGPKSYKPGDVFRSRSGLCVEITNTDAEGRLVLADTISYLEDHYKLSSVIDLATLTGGVVIALGEEAAGLFSNDEKLAKQIEESAERTHERAWRLPLYQEYRDYLKSPIADLKNSASRKASAASGAAFIYAFVKSRSWAHLDIAGTAYLSETKPYHSTFATGYGVRLLIDFLEHRK